MKCPICGSSYGYFSCRSCGLYDTTYMQETCRPVNRAYKLEQILFCTFDSRTPDPTYTPTLEEALRIFRHSEWAQWRDCPTLRTDPFIQSLFADWCADNGFPLQEQAVRQRLQEAEGRWHPSPN